MGFNQSTEDYSLFYKRTDTSLVVLLVYVDDIIIASQNQDLITQTISKLQDKFQLKVLGDRKYFLGLEIAKSSQGIHLSHRKYSLELLDDTGFAASKRAKVPMDLGIQLDNTIGELFPDPFLFRRLVGRLMYLTISRSDIIFATNKMSQFMAVPQIPHLHALNQVLQYLK